MIRYADTFSFRGKDPLASLPILKASALQLPKPQLRGHPLTPNPFRYQRPPTAKDLDYGRPPRRDPNNIEAKQMVLEERYDAALRAQGRAYMRAGITPDTHIGQLALLRARGSHLL